jgi:hypothetical protein
LLTEYREAAVTKFWEQVQKSEDPDGCWIWTGAVAKAGYPVVWMGIGDKKTSARIFSYRLNVDETEVGSIKPCRHNSMCVNPAHLNANHSKAGEISDERVNELRANVTNWLVNHRKAYRRKVSMY